MPLAFGAGLFVSFASFFQPNTEQGPTGNVTGDPTPIDGLQSIPCMNAPERAGTIGMSSDETRKNDYIEAMRTRHVLLNAYFPALDTGFATGAGNGWQASILDPGGVPATYIFLGGEGDSQQTQTRCRLQLVTV